MDCVDFFIAFCMCYNVLGVAGKNIYVNDGAAVTLECPDKPVMSWQDTTGRNHLYATCIGTPSIHKDLRISSRLSITGNCDLTIQNFTYDDASTYRCNVNGGIQRDVKVQVKQPPTNMTINGVDTFTEILGLEGKDVIITCNVRSGVPKETLYWQKNNTILVSGGSGEVQYKFVAGKDHESELFTCIANSSGTDKQLNLTVKFKLLSRPSLAIVTSKKENVTEGDRIEITCQEQSNHSVTYFAWLYKDRYISYRTNTMLFKPITRLNAGEYVCLGHNDAGQSEAKLTLSVYYAPTIRNTTITLTGEMNRYLVCQVDSNPKTLMFGRWQHLSTYAEHIRFITGNINGTLFLPVVTRQDVQYEDSGIYVCNVSNNVKSLSGQYWQTGYINVNVAGIPVFAEPEGDIQLGHLKNISKIVVHVYSFTNILRSQWLNENMKPVNNESCVYTRISAKFYDQEVGAMGYECTLKIYKTKESDFQNYTFTVENNHGISSLTVSLKSVGGPDTPIIASIIAGNKSIKVKWLKGSNGGLDQSFYFEYRLTTGDKWSVKQIQDKSIRNKQILYLNDLEPSTEYVVRMIAINRRGNSSYTKEWKVKTTDEAERTNITVYIVLTAVSVLGIVIVIYFWRWKKAKFRHASVNADPRNADHAGQAQDMAVRNVFDQEMQDLVESSVTVGASSDVYSLKDRRRMFSNAPKVSFKVSQKGPGGYTGENLAHIGRTHDEKISIHGNPVTCGLAAWHKNSIVSLNYIEVVFDQKQKSGIFVIRGVDNRTAYAEINYDVTAEPLSSSSDDSSDSCNDEERDDISCSMETDNETCF